MAIKVSAKMEMCKRGREEVDILVEIGLKVYVSYFILIFSTVPGKGKSTTVQ